MGNDIVEKIMKVSEMTGGIDEIVVFTESFKIYGSIAKDEKKPLKNILTLKNASVCHHFDECNCSIDSPAYEWLNINEEKIVAFTILGYQSCAN